MRKKIIFVIFTLILLIFSFSLFYAIKYEKIEIARAGVGDNLEGFAWSSNFGWVNFNCTTDADCSPDYGVNIDADYNYNFSGYAWSSNIGWISFEEVPTPDSSFRTHCNIQALCNDANNCSACLRTDPDPTNGDQYYVYGWAKALALGDDGWIRLDDHNGAAAPNYGVSIDNSTIPATNQFTGFAWNGDPSGYVGIGWLSFNCNSPGAGGCPPNYAVTAPRITPPTPTNVVITPESCTGVNIDWEDKINVQYYEVWREDPPHNDGWLPTAEGTELLPNLAINHYDDDNLDPLTFHYGQPIYYKVRSYNEFGYSLFSLEASGRTEPVCAPGFSITATTTGICPDTIRVAWGEVENADYYALSRCHCASVADCGDCDLNIDPDNSENYKYIKTGDCYNTTGHCSSSECYCDDDTIPSGEENEYFRYMLSAVATGWPSFPDPFFGASSTPTYPPKQPCPIAPTWKEVK